MKIVILGGGGGVGSSAAFNLLLQADPHDVVLVDCRAEMVDSHVLDLEQVLELGAAGSVRGGGLDDVVDADVVVVTASAPLTVNTSRLEYLAANVTIVGSLVEAVRHDWPGILLVVTNPVDPICTWLQRRTGIDRARVLGYTLNDSLRLRTGIAKALRVDPGTVDAWVLGEHGDASVPLFDRVRIGGDAVSLTETERDAAEEFLRTWYVKHVALDSGRSSTWTSGIGVARMVQAIGAGTGELWPASVVLAGEYGVDGVALTVPVTLGRGGARIHEWPLSADQRDALERSAATVREATVGIGAPVARPS
jgi:malate/lactate dehydrogenase